MKNDLSVKNRVERALNSLDNVHPAEPSPYFYSKVLAKTNRDKTAAWENWSAFFLRPTIAFATVCFVIVANIFVLYSKINSDIPSAAQQELALSDEYNNTVNALYDLENVNP